MLLLEISTLFPGPLAGRVLQSAGFRVVKVEPPGGDPLSAYLPALYSLLNEGKEIVKVDLRAGGGGLVRELAKEADAVLTTLRPSTAAKFGVSYERLREVKRELVYLSIVGYGDRDWPAHDLNLAGLAAHFVQSPPLALSVDVATALYAAYLVATRVWKREWGYVELAMEDVAYLLNLLAIAAEKEGRPVFTTGVYPLYRVYTCKGGAVTVAALEEKFWQKFVEAIGRPDLADRAYDPAAAAEVEKAVGEMDCGELLALSADVPIAPVRSLGQVADALDLRRLFERLKL